MSDTQRDRKNGDTGRDRDVGQSADRRGLEGAEARILLRPIASPLALGFLALGGATVVLSGQQLGWIPAREAEYVAFALMAFGFPLQLLAAVFGFLARDAVAATGMGVLAGSWLVVGLVTYASPPGSTSAALGTFLLFAGAALLVPAAGAALGKLVPALVLLTAAVRFALTGAYQLTGGPGWQGAAGVVGLVLLGIAFYAALALEIEGIKRKTVLPVLRRGEGRSAVEGDLGDQLRSVENEAGVREQL